VRKKKAKKKKEKAVAAHLGGYGFSKSVADPLLIINSYSQ
jgi:hypothetical protein